MPTCRILFEQLERREASRAACTAGKSRAIRTPMIAMTTSNSTSVKARRTLDEDIGQSLRERKGGTNLCGLLPSSQHSLSVEPVRRAHKEIPRTRARFYEGGFGSCP